MATPLRYAEICNERFTANFLMSVAEKDFLKSAIIWQR